MKNNIKFNLNSIYFLLIISILVLGTYLRFYLYFKNIPFWFDERFLGLFFKNDNYLLFFKSFSTGIKIPPLWGVINQLIINIFGYSFFSFRFISFISGVLLLPAFFILLTNIFKNKIAIITALLLISVNPWLIYYSNEFRPYSLDVFVCILLLISYKFVSFKQKPFPVIILYTIISVILVLTSFPAMFIIPSILFAKSIEEKYFNYRCLVILAGICCVCLYLYFMDKECYKFMLHDWNYILNCFWTPSLKSFSMVIDNLFKYVFINYSYKIKIIEFFAFIGLIFIFIDKDKKRYLFLFIIIFALLASLFKIYPLGHRVSLYLIPIIIILITKVVEFPVNNKLPSDISKSLIISCIILFMIKNPLSDYLNFIYEKFTENVKTRNDYMVYSKEFLNKYGQGDVILSANTISSSLKFYNNYFKMNKNLIIVEFIVNNEAAEINLLESMLSQKNQGDKKLWILTLKKSWEVSDNNIKNIEEKIKKYNIPYKKLIYNNFYTYEING